MLGLSQRRKTHPIRTGTAADISGSVSDSQLAIGEHIVQNNIAAGAIVNQIASDSAPRPPRARAKPVSVKPREAPRLVGRDAELATATAALTASEPVQFCGRSGVGKTALLRHLAHHRGGAFTDGVIYYRSRSDSLDDLLMRIFEFLYEFEGRVKPTAAELCVYLEDTQALLLLDDVDLEREDVETLLCTLPRSVFVFGSPERSLWCDGTAIGLRGLRDDAVLMLVEQYLGRPLAGDEVADFAALCRALDNQPLQIIKAVTQVREEGVTPRELLPAQPPSAAVPLASAPELLGAQIADALSPEARQTLTLLAALSGAPLHVDHVAALTGRQDSAALLAELERRGLAKSHSPRYSATAPLPALQPSHAEAQWRTQLLSHFARHAEAHADRPELLRDDLEPIIATLRCGAAAGAWRDVLRLARSADGAAAFSGLWDAWRTILDSALNAARRVGDEAQEAWALHQLGTRALCLGHADEAGRRLSEALRIRERIGDRAAEVTRHNMSHLPGPPPPPPRPPTGPRSAPTWIVPLGVAIVALVAAAAIILPGGDAFNAATPTGNPDTENAPRYDPPADDDHNPGPERAPWQDDAPQRTQIRAISPPVVPDRDSNRDSTPGSNRDSTPGSNRDSNSGSSSDPRPRPERQQPPPPPPPPRRNCSLDLVNLVNSTIEDELVVLQRLLDGELSPALQAQVDVLQRLLAKLAQCSASQTTQLLKSPAAP